MPLFELRPFGLTDAGKVRQNNEDSMLVGDGADETLFAVADGIGGFEAGEVASSIAIEVLQDLRPDATFDAAVAEANRRILAVGRSDGRLAGMGTTVVAARFGVRRGEPVAEVAHVGDSRAYLVRGGELRPITEDHSLVAELVRSGDLTRDQAAEHPQKNLITRALGAEERVEVDTAILPVEVGDRILLCSDGLSDMVPEARVSEILAEAPDDPERAARSLLDAALDAGGNDNVTVLIVDVAEREPPSRARAGEDRRSEGTSEMPAVAPPVAQNGTSGGRTSGVGLSEGGLSGGRVSDRPAPRTRRPPRGGAGRVKVRRKRRAKVRKALGRLVRWLAVAVVVLIALTPAYLWGSSRYYFAFETGEVVAYRGLPYAPFGVELNEEWRRPGLRESEIKEPYEKPIEDNKLYTRGDAERVLGDMGK